jgi:hypothetical protein
MTIMAFNPQGDTQTFTSAVSPPSPVQVTSTTGAATQYRIINTSSQYTVFMGVGATSAAATTNATTSLPARTIPVLPGTDEILTFIPNAYFTGATTAGTAVIYITPGSGS